MARRKQAAPLLRAASSEIMERPLENGSSELYMNGHSRAPRSKVEQATTPEVSEQAGLTQLIICIGGIYASLYVLREPSIEWHTDSHPVYRGLSSRNA